MAGGHALLGLTNYVALGSLGILEMSAAAQRGEAGQSGTAYAVVYTTRIAGASACGMPRTAMATGLGVAGGRHAPLRDDQVSVGVRLGSGVDPAGAVVRDSRTFGERGCCARAWANGQAGLSQRQRRSLYAAADDTEFNLTLRFRWRDSARRPPWVSERAMRSARACALQRSLPLGLGTAIACCMSRPLPVPSTQADVGLRGNAGALSAYLYRVDSGTAARGGASGARSGQRSGRVPGADDDGGSFAVVKMPQAMCRSCANTRWPPPRAWMRRVVSGLRPFERKRLGVQPTPWMQRAGSNAPAWRSSPGADRCCLRISAPRAFPR